MDDPFSLTARIAFAGLIGLIAGSFLNVIIHRGPAWWGLLDEPVDRGTLWGPRSQCPLCRTQIRSWDNIPLVSYFLLRGKCRDCNTKINPRYLMVEVLGAVIAISALVQFGPTLAGLGFAVFGWLLIALAAIDAETGFLPDVLTYSLMVLGLTINIVGTFVPIFDAAIGAFVGFGIFWLIATGYRFFRGQEGLGLGDAKLLGAIGAWFGWTILAPVVLVASVLAIFMVLASAKRNEELSATTPIRFGPALAFGGVVVGIAYQSFAVNF